MFEVFTRVGKMCHTLMPWHVCVFVIVVCVHDGRYHDKGEKAFCHVVYMCDVLAMVYVIACACV